MNSLQFKASLMVIALVLVVTLLGLGACIKLTAEAMYAHSRSHAFDWAESLASGASQSVAAGNREHLVEIINDSLATRGVAYIAFADPRRHILASGEETIGLLEKVTAEQGSTLRIDNLSRPQLAHDARLDLSYIDLVVPVYSSRRFVDERQSPRMVIGYLRMATNVSRADLYVRAMSSHLRRMSIIALLLVAPCTLIAMRKVVSPLNELAKTARALASGVMDARARVSAHNEIGDLARAFNEMADRLAGAQFEMLKLNSELEERVQQRTHELEDLAARDPLTGLHNRRHFSEVMNREFAAAERYDADLTCVMIDLDHFKQTNDQFGHRTGDEVLTVAASSIRAELRESDVAARFGGDEFILLLPRASASAAFNLADRIVTRFTETIARDMPQVPATLSLGVASLRVTRARSAEALIHEADTALYAAKMGGRNRAVAAKSTGV